MASHDPFWGMPEENWQPTSSFNVPIAPPLDDPLVGPLVQLPCVNVQWVPIILGCLSQLTDPGVWLASLTDDQRSLVLNRVDNLRSAMAGTVSTPCCNVQIRLTADCKLQFSVDGGASYHDVTGWDTNLHGCVVANIPPPLPPAMPSVPPDQYTCNIAGFLSKLLIQETMSKIHDLVAAGQTKDFIFTGVMAALGIFFPEIDGAAVALNNFITAVIAQTLSEINFVATDPVFWGEVTCAIFNAIRSDGHLTPANIITAAGNITGISYPGHVWAPPACGAYFLALGFVNLLQAQSSGAVEDIDCASCGTWCAKFDFTVASQGWVVGPSPYVGTFVPGTGFVSATRGGLAEVGIHFPFPAAHYITDVIVEFSATAASGGSTREIDYQAGGVTIGFCAVDPNAEPAFTTSGCHAINHVVDSVIIVIRSSNPASTNTIRSVEFKGTGANPFSVQPCTY